MNRMAYPVPNNIEMQIYNLDKTHPEVNKDEKPYHASPERDFMYKKSGETILKAP